MHAKYVFSLESQDRKRDLPGKIIIAQRETETPVQVLQKLFGYLLFFRPRLLMDTNLHDEYIPFVPDLVQLDYQLQPALWVECGETNPTRLNKLAVKVHEAEIWIVRHSREEADALIRLMDKANSRRDRYKFVVLDAEMIEEVSTMTHGRNSVTWYHGSFETPLMQFDYNGMWFEAEFEVLNY